MSGKPLIRKMRRDELDLAVGWAEREGWNPGLRDAELFHLVDPDGFFMAFIDGQPVGSVSAVAYDDHFGFIGLYIVAPEHRGGSVGVELGRKALERLGGRNIGIDGVEKKIKNYLWCGFKLAHNNVRYEGVVKDGKRSAGVTPANRLPAKVLSDYDNLHFPAPRPAFISSWTSQPGCVSLCRMDGEKPIGLGVARQCARGHKIGPLFADKPETAEELFNAISADLPSGAPVFLDVPAVNKAAVAMAERHGMRPVFRTARMYSKTAPELPFDHIFGITTFELG